MVLRLNWAYELCQVAIRPQLKLVQSHLHILAKCKYDG